MSNYLSLDPMELPVPKRHGYLLAAVAPRPIAFVSSVDEEGKVNLSPFSFFNVFSSNPPIMVFSPARSGRDGSEKHTHLNVKEVPEVVINIVNYPMVEQMSLASTAYEKGVNEFVKAGFTAIDSEVVKPPRVAEAPAAFECKVEDIVELGHEGSSGNLVICRVLRMHYREEYLDENKKVDTEKIDLVGRMGGAWYSRAAGEALFQVAKPGIQKGIGVDQLPESIRNSHVLSGNDLGQLGGLASLPEKEAIQAITNTPDVQALVEDLGSEEQLFALHKLAKTYIKSGEVEKALQILMLRA
ncbi:MAG: flavin reductase family protein [Bacteroidota bacterium]